MGLSPSGSKSRQEDLLTPDVYFALHSSNASQAGISFRPWLKTQAKYKLQAKSVLLTCKVQT